MSRLVRIYTLLFCFIENWKNPLQKLRSKIVNRKKSVSLTKGFEPRYPEVRIECSNQCDSGHKNCNDKICKNYLNGLDTSSRVRLYFKMEVTFLTSHLLFRGSKFLSFRDGPLLEGGKINFDRLKMYQHSP